MITRVALLLVLSSVFGCGPPRYTYFFATKGGAQRFPKHIQSRPSDSGKPDGGATQSPPPR